MRRNLRMDLHMGFMCSIILESAHAAHAAHEFDPRDENHGDAPGINNPCAALFWNLRMLRMLHMNLT